MLHYVKYIIATIKASRPGPVKKKFPIRAAPDFIAKQISFSCRPDRLRLGGNDRPALRAFLHVAPLKGREWVVAGTIANKGAKQ